MPALPVLRPREVIAILSALGFREARQPGSHKRFVHTDGGSSTPEIRSQPMQMATPLAAGLS